MCPRCQVKIAETKYGPDIGDVTNKVFKPCPQCGVSISYYDYTTIKQNP